MRFDPAFLLLGFTPLEEPPAGRPKSLAQTSRALHRLPVPAVMLVLLIDGEAEHHQPSPPVGIAMNKDLQGAGGLQLECLP
jgi:hypothetical protein